MPPRWRKTIDISSILSRIGKEIATLIRANTSGDEQADEELTESLEILDTLDPTDGNFAIEEFSDALTDISDWADRERIWVGPPKS
jgi:hypothetical protein